MVAKKIPAFIKKMMEKKKKGFGAKDGSKKGKKLGGKGRNQTSVCRHPKK